MSLNSHCNLIETPFWKEGWMDGLAPWLAQLVQSGYFLGFSYPLSPPLVSIKPLRFQIHKQL